MHTKSESTVSSLLYIFRCYFFSSLWLLRNFLETSDIFFYKKTQIITNYMEPLKCTFSKRTSERNLEIEFSCTNFWSLNSYNRDFCNNVLLNLLLLAHDIIKSSNFVQISYKTVFLSASNLKKESYHAVGSWWMSISPF